MGTRIDGYVIELKNLPKGLKGKSTVKLMQTYDKDHNGFLESSNSTKFNEIGALEKSLGVDLTKYKQKGHVTSNEQDIYYRDDNGTCNVENDGTNNPKYWWPVCAETTCKYDDGRTVKLTACYEKNYHNFKEERPGVAARFYGDYVERTEKKGGKTTTTDYDPSTYSVPEQKKVVKKTTTQQKSQPGILERAWNRICSFF